MRTVIISGATSGIGLAVARALLAEDWRVIGIGSTPQSCAAALGSLTEYQKDHALFFSGDMMQQREVNRLADELDEEREKPEFDAVFLGKGIALALADLDNRRHIDLVEGR